MDAMVGHINKCPCRNHPNPSIDHYQAHETTHGGKKDEGRSTEMQSNATSTSDLNSVICELKTLDISIL